MFTFGMIFFGGYLFYVILLTGFYEVMAEEVKRREPITQPASRGLLYTIFFLVSLFTAFGWWFFLPRMVYRRVTTGKWYDFKELDKRAPRR